MKNTYRWTKISLFFAITTTLSNSQPTTPQSVFNDIQAFFGIQNGRLPVQQTKLLIRNVLYRAKCDESQVDCTKCLNINSVHKYLNLSNQTYLDESSFNQLSKVLVVFMKDLHGGCSIDLQTMRSPMLENKLRGSHKVFNFAAVLDILKSIKRNYRFGTIVLDENGVLIEEQSEVVDFDTDFNCFSPQTLYRDLGIEPEEPIQENVTVAFTGLIVYNVLKGRCVSLNDKPSRFTFMADVMAWFGNRSKKIFDHEEFENLLEAMDIGKANPSEPSQTQSLRNQYFASKLNETQILEEKILMDAVLDSSISPCLLRNCYSVEDLRRIHQANMSAILDPIDIRKECSDLISAILVPSHFIQPHYSNNNMNGIRNKTDVGLSIAAAFGYGALSVTVISLSPLLGLVFPIIFGERVKGHILCFLIAMAISSLSGDALLHLLRQALGINRTTGGILDGLPFNESLLKMLTVLTSVYVFIVLQMTLSMIGRQKNYKVNDQSVHGNKNSPEVEIAQGHQKAVISLLVMGDMVHNFVDGLAIGASFLGGLSAGLSTSIAIVLHELPHELGDMATLWLSGLSCPRILLLTLGSGIAAFVGLGVGVPLAATIGGKDWMFAVTAGVFLYVALANLVPELIRQLRESSSICLTFTLINLGLIFGYSVMILVAIFEEHIQI